MKTKQWLVSIFLITVTVVLGAKLLQIPVFERAHHGEHEDHGGHEDHEGHEDHGGHEDHEGHKDHEEARRGRHGGWLFGEEFQVELKIFEEGRPPEFRAFGYFRGKLIDPKTFEVKVELKRLDEPEEVVLFHQEDGYLLGDLVVRDPHSFDITIHSVFEDRKYSWKYAQIEGRIQLSESARKRAGVTIQKAGPRTLLRQLILPGEIRYNEDRLAHVVLRMGGVVTKVFKKQGDLVKRGEILAVIESREIAQMRGEFQASVKRLELARTILEREQKLWDKKQGAEQDYLEAQQRFEEAKIASEVAHWALLAIGVDKGSQKQINLSNPKVSSLTIHAPMDGTIIEKHLTPGEAMTAGNQLYTIADLTQLWGEIFVYAKDIPAVKMGQKVLVRSRDMKQTSSGEIIYLSPELGRETQSAKARILVPNPRGLWRPGLFVNMEIQADRVEVPLAVQRSALQTFRDWTVVFIQAGDHFEARPLTLGRKDEAFVEVLRGLRAGQRYVSSNSFLIKADIEKAGASHDH